MTVPKYIKDKMHSVARYAQMSDGAMKVVEAWLEDHGIDPSVLRDGDGYSLEELEYGNDVTAALCERISKM